MISPRWLRLSKFILPVVLVLLLSLYYWIDPKLTAFSKTPWTKGGDNDSGHENNNKLTTITKEQFIQNASAWEIDGPFNNIPLHDLCKSKEWQLGLVFKCDDAFGGIGNIRNIILTCIRYAIEAGGQTNFLPCAMRIC
jgi:hypothetical protein